MTDFWETIIAAELASASNDSMDNFLNGRSIEAGDFDDVRAITDKGREANALTLPVKAGTEVQFVGNLGSVLAYSDPPRPGSTGTVVAVKSATGMVTAHDGKVFVQWSDGQLRTVHAAHLRLVGKPVKRTGNAVRVASLDLTEFLKMSSDTLVHKATRDLWSFRHDGGAFVLERLFDSAGEPIKG